MKVIFIAYADPTMAYSLERIGRQARKLGIFDNVILYTPADVPTYVKECPLFSAPRGAGYWCWKPAIIDMTLKRFDEGDIVVYADAGCTLRKSPQWAEYLRYMKDYDTVCFQYAESQPQWKKWGSGSAKIKYWTKKATLDFMKEYVQQTDIGEISQILGGLLIMKGKENAVLQQWKKLIFNHPELITDPTAEELVNQYPGFAGHRHDQSLLTPLAFTDPDTLILPEVSERYRRNSFVWASRCRAANRREYLAWKIKTWTRHLLGSQLLEGIKALRQR